MKFLKEPLKLSDFELIDLEPFLVVNPDPIGFLLFSPDIVLGFLLFSPDASLSDFLI